MKLILYIAVLVAVFGDFVIEYLPKGSYYILVAVLITSLCTHLFLSNRKSFVRFLLLALSINNLADELDADRFAAAPDHLAAASGPGVARKRQPQLRRQRIGIIDRDLRPRRGQILHHALPRGKTTVERDPPGLTQ